MHLISAYVTKTNASQITAEPYFEWQKSPIWNGKRAQCLTQSVNSVVLGRLDAKFQQTREPRLKWQKSPISNGKRALFRVAKEPHV